MLITKKSLLATIAKHDGILTTSDVVSCHCKTSHINRAQDTIRKILRNGWIWMDETGKLFITDHGKAKLEAWTPAPQNTVLLAP